ncbi:CoA transferase [Nocardioides sp. JQ2195]|uniref:CaiB/BaiF CoA transferase family protein n=1 Tax=Nocardioides sp. JQ2195 TaxID=2592334 RepID=UPI00143ED304|nr:CoA transferase [Nocardioides sp. JQ2195]QIX25306.1 CoA transferase [Nocardioides sp. JQ2195]
MKPTAQAPLAGVTVIELSTVFMAPYCAQLLAEWGADVIKVESPDGDTVRSINDHQGSGLGPVFVTANRGKRSVALDLKDPRGMAALRSLVADADVFLHNIRPPAARRLGITGEELLEINPRLIHCGFRGFGAGGPYADQPAYDDVIQAASGVAAAQAVDGSEPAYWRSAAADKIMGLYGAAAISAALAGRGSTDLGRIIEVPMFEGMASFMLLDRQGGWVQNPPTGPTGYARTDSEHRKPYRTSDGHLSVMVYADKQWLAFFDLIGKPELGSDPRFATIGARTRNIDELYSILADEMLRHTTQEWMALFRAADIPHGPVNSIEDLFEDEHLVATEFFHTLDQPGLGEVRLARSPISMGVPPHPARPAPRLGEHTEQVLEGTGLGPDDVAKLVADGVAVALPRD